jgi:hypothetical protein
MHALASALCLVSDTDLDAQVYDGSAKKRAYLGSRFGSPVMTEDQRTLWTTTFIWIAIIAVIILILYHQGVPFW